MKVGDRQMVFGGNESKRKPICSSAFVQLLCFTGGRSKVIEKVDGMLQTRSV